MAFTIDTYDRSHLEGMTALYNEETAFETYIAPLNPERFIELVEKKSYFDPSGLFVALKAGKVIGWTHACVAAGSEARHNPDDRVPRIRMLIYPPDRLKVGRALVAEATAWLKKSGRKEILAMHSKAGYPFYRGLWIGCEPKCPVTMPHLQLAFEVGGYKNTLESIVMVAEMDSAPNVPAASMPLELVTSAAEMAHEPMRESWIGFEPMTTQAFSHGKEVGAIRWTVLPYMADRLGAPCMNIWGMGVRGECRRKGIGTALIRRAMADAYPQGARFASVSTQLWNAPAHATYARAGFGPHCITVGRTLDEDDE